MLEVVEDDRGDTYRAVYTVKNSGWVYVLHCFQKKSKSGIKTPKQDLDLIHARLKIARAIKARRLTQQGAAELLGVDQSKVSRITRGQFRGVSEAKLLELLTRLGHDVKIVVGPVRRRAGKIELQFV